LLRLSFGCAALLTALSFGSVSAQTPPAPVPPTQTPSAPAPAVPADASVPAAAPAYLTLGGYNVLCLRGTAGGMTPAQRIEVITSRITPLLGNPVILPSNVVVYLPPPKSRYNRYPVIYALGRRIVTVDPATVKASGLIQTPLQAAVIWAKKLQQVLPRVNWRPSNAPEPKIPANPPLLVTPDFAKVGGQTAMVTLHEKAVLKLRGPQPGGMTAAERADMLTARLERLANLPAALAPDAVQVTDLPTGDATLALAGTPLLSVTAADAKAASLATPDLLAQSWAKNLRLALAPANPVLPAAPAGGSPPAAALPTTIVPPTSPATPPATLGATAAPTP
jgi:hypothetical protein